MASIDTILLPRGWRVPDLWAAVAEEAAAWMARVGAAPRDAVLLLPFAALLAPARAALAARGGWQPRVETPLTLASTLGPPPVLPAGSCQGQLTHDRLAAAQLLRRQAWGAEWERRDSAGFTHVTSLVVEAAQVLREAALARPPQAREDFWASARAAAAPASGPAATEHLLLRFAIEWAAASGDAATDRLFALRPSAWMAVQIGGTEALGEQLLLASGAPALRLVADLGAEDPWGPVAGFETIERIVCDDFETEAQAAASQVIEALNAGRTPVALVALDREVVRRVRALLERLPVPLVDETGWLLSTTPAATSVVALLRAALPEAGADARLEWLKGWPPAPQAALDVLEAHWRGRRVAMDLAPALALWAEAQQHLLPLTEAGPRTLAAWLELLQATLARDGSLDPLAAAPAGQQTLLALGLQGVAPWMAAAAQARCDLRGFIAWVESTLEASPFLPPPDEGAAVVLTPLARAFGRPFGHVVMPGTDHQHLGAGVAPPTLLTAAVKAAIGADDETRRRWRQRQALAHALRAGRVTLLRRRRGDDEPLDESPDIEWLLQTRARQGLAPWPQLAWQPPTRQVPAAPTVPPQPTAALALPARLSATQLEYLRQCPYRFFARAVLRLDDPDELDAALDKRDYGTWLHAVLHAFHVQRRPGDDDLGQLRAAADGATRTLDVDAGELLPFRASFEHFAPAYLAWLRAREARGQHWHSGETEHVLQSPLLPGLQLRGVLDRLDRGPGEALQVLDYKTGNADALARKVKQPLEDTQLAFYAALLGEQPLLDATYLALDDAQAPRQIDHREVRRSAQALLLGLSAEWERLRAGAALPALGEGAVCETCEARGLCRRDHWAPR